MAWYHHCNTRPGYGYYIWTAGLRLDPNQLHAFVWQLRTSRMQVGITREEDDHKTNSPMNYAHWQADQPDNAGGHEHCVNMWPNRHFMWNDENCAHEYCFVCEDRNHR